MSIAGSASRITQTQNKACVVAGVVHLALPSMGTRLQPHNLDPMQTPGRHTHLLCGCKGDALLLAATSANVIHICICLKCHAHHIVTLHQHAANTRHTDGYLSGNVRVAEIASMRVGCDFSSAHALAANTTTHQHAAMYTLHMTMCVCARVQCLLSPGTCLP